MRKKLYGAFFLVFLLLLSAVIGMADYLTVPASAFRGWVTDPDSIYFVGVRSSSRWIYTETQPGDAGYCYAEVNLPHGVRIDNVILFYQDNHATADIECTFWKNYQLTDSSEELFSVKTSGQSAALQYLGDWTLNEGVRYVNNNTHQYTIRIQFEAASSNLKCFGVQIRYH